MTRAEFKCVEFVCPKSNNLIRTIGVENLNYGEFCEDGKRQTIAFLEVWCYHCGEYHTLDETPIVD